MSPAAMSRCTGSSSVTTVVARRIAVAVLPTPLAPPLNWGGMPKLYEYFGLVFLFYSDDHDPLHLHVQHGEREGIIMLTRRVK